MRREQMIQQVIARRDAREHLAHSPRSFLLVSCALGLRALWQGVRFTHAFPRANPWVPSETVDRTARREWRSPPAPCHMTLRFPAAGTARTVPSRISPSCPLAWRQIAFGLKPQANPAAAQFAALTQLP